jgi:hypothetical protein
MDGKIEILAAVRTPWIAKRPIIYVKCLRDKGLYQSARAGFADSSSGVAARSEGGVDADGVMRFFAVPTAIYAPSRCEPTRAKNIRPREAHYSRGGSRGSTGGGNSYSAAVGNFPVAPKLRDVFLIPPPLHTARTTAIAVRMQQAEGIFATAPHAPFGVGCHAFTGR